MATVAAGDADRASDNFTNPLIDGESEQQINPEILSHRDENPMEEEKGEKEEKKEGMEKLKSSLLVSGVVIAIIGALFALSKKFKEAAQNTT